MYQKKEPAENIFCGFFTKENYLLVACGDSKEFLSFTSWHVDCGLNEVSVVNVIYGDDGKVYWSPIDKVGTFFQHNLNVYRLVDCVVHAEECFICTAINCVYNW